MASISRDANGHTRVLFVDRDRKRKALRLGKLSQRLVEEIKVKVETLNAASIGGLSIDGETAAWLSKIGDALHAKLAAVGLVASRVAVSEDAAALGPWLERYITSRTDVKPNTRRNLNMARGRLLDFFGADKDMRQITVGDADEWALWLKEHYADATVGRTIKWGRQFFRAAGRKKIVKENPFDDIKPPAQTNESRKVFVSRATAAKVIGACPDAEWRLIFALSRYGGLRCPSEHLALQWTDFDWERDRFRVDSPKTGVRWVPIFPELSPHLEEAFELAPEGATHIIRRYRDTNSNLRTQVLRIIKRAGVEPWGKPFQNLRASRETELAAEFPIHVVCAWIGNTVAVAAKHYLQVVDADFARAAKGGAESGALVAQKGAQQPAALSRTNRQEWAEVSEGCDVVRDVSICCDSLLNKGILPTGFEPVSRP